MGDEEIPGAGESVEGTTAPAAPPPLVWKEEGGQEIGKFSDFGVQAAIDRALAKAPPGDNLVIVGHADQNGAFVAAAIQKDIGFGKLEWSIEVVKPKDSKVEWKTEIVATVPL